MATKYNQVGTYLDYEDVYRGNAIISIGAFGSSPSYTAVGAIKDVAIVKEITVSQEEVDNAQPTSVITKWEMLLRFKWIETLNDTIRALLWSGTETRTTTAAGALTPATPDNDQVIYAGDTTDFKPVLLNLANADGTVPTLTSVTGSVSGALAADDDYYLCATNGTHWQIYFDESGTNTVDLSAENITIVWGELNQAASITYTGGTGTALNNLSVKVTSANDDRTVTWTFFNMEIDSVEDLALAPDDAEDRRNPEGLVLRGRPDYTYHSGEVYQRVVNT